MMPRPSCVRPRAQVFAPSARDTGDLSWPARRSAHLASLHSINLAILGRVNEREVPHVAQLRDHH